MTDIKKNAQDVDKIAYHYPVVDLEKKQVKAVVTIDARTYLNAHVDLYNGMIHVEKFNEGTSNSFVSDKMMIDEIRAMAEFIIDHEIENYCKNFLN